MQQIYNHVAVFCCNLLATFYIIHLFPKVKKQLYASPNMVNLVEICPYLERKEYGVPSPYFSGSHSQASPHNWTYFILYILLPLFVLTKSYLMSRDIIIHLSQQIKDTSHQLCLTLWPLFPTEMVRTATPFPMVSLLFVFTAFVISNIGHIRPQRTILAFVSGIFFILSGGTHYSCPTVALWLITAAWCVLCHTWKHSITALFLVYDAGV